MPLGLDRATIANLFFVFLCVGGLLGAFRLFERSYGPLLCWCLEHKGTFLLAPVALFVTALCVWLGFPKVFSFMPKILGAGITETRLWEEAAN